MKCPKWTQDYCMCGEPIEGHGYYSGHGAVSQWDYYECTEEEAEENIDGNNNRPSTGERPTQGPTEGLGIQCARLHRDLGSLQRPRKTANTSLASYLQLQSELASSNAFNDVKRSKGRRLP